MRPEQFISRHTGALVEIHGGQYAFVPKPLPPAFACESEVLQESETALLALGELKTIIPFMPNPELLTYPFLRREAVLSSKIEGTHTELEQLYLFETETGRQNRSQIPADAQEVHNYVVALEYGLSELKTMPVCNRLLRKMHEILMDGVAHERGLYKNPGRFRPDQAFIGPTRDIEMARYIPPPAELIPDLMASLEEYLNSEMKYHPSLVRIALAHYQFEAIHPFSDGNGRVGRLLISLLLAAWGLLPQPLLYLSAHFERRVDEYRDPLWRVSCDEDWTGWIFCRGCGMRPRTLRGGHASCSISGRVIARRCRSRGGSGSLLALSDHLFRYPFLTITDAAEVLKMTYNSGMKNVEKLVEAGILFEYGDRAWGRIYYAKPILEVLG